MTEHTLPIDARVIALPETEYYNIDKEDVPFIQEIYGIYLYDKNMHTYVCEMTPSYWLIHIENQIRLTEKGEQLSDNERDKLQQHYCYESSDNEYMHCSGVDTIEEKYKDTLGTYRYAVYGGTDITYEDTDYDEQIETIREYVSCNSMI